MSSYTQTQSSTFTVVHARHMAAKVATDLRRMQRFYGSPSDARIVEYEAEVVELLKAGYLGTVTYGFKRNDRWIAPTLRYTAQDLASGAVNDDPGRLVMGADVASANFYAFLTYSDKWHTLSPEDKAAFKKTLPFQRGTANEPGVEGYFVSDLTYSAGGRAMARSSIRSY